MGQILQDQTLWELRNDGRKEIKKRFKKKKKKKHLIKELKAKCNELTVKKVQKLRILGVAMVT